jgi:hypothetical protein
MNQSQVTVGELELKYQAAPATLSPDVEIGDVLEVLEMIASCRTGECDFELLAHLGKTSVPKLCLILETCELLLLTRTNEKGIVYLTELGATFEQQPESRTRIMKERLSKIEPFLSAIELTNRKASTSTTEIVDMLDKKGTKWRDESDELNADVVHSLLVDWALTTGLLKYDGRADRFFKPPD